MIASILSIGDEVLIGQVVNSNAAAIGVRLSEIGVQFARVLTVGDDEEAIRIGLEELIGTSDLVLVTGGLGPTHDDVTRNVVCRVFKTDLVRSEEVLANVRSLARQRNIALTAAAEDQAMVPRAARLIPNRVGTAPGLIFERSGKHVIVMPGVPYEMEAMMAETVVPFVAGLPTESTVVHSTLNTTGISETILSDQLGDLDQLLDGAKLAFLPSPLGVRLRVTVAGRDREAANRRVKEIESRIRAKAEKHIFSVGDETLEQVVGKLLAAKHLTLAVAESCTGGLICDRITDVPGSSEYFERGVIAYSNKTKVDLLSVDEGLIRTHGAVSREVAEAMASGVRTLARTDVGLSTTGIAGPGGGSAEKPVGLVWIGYADDREALALKFNFAIDRRRIKERASQAALELLRRKLLRLT